MTISEKSKVYLMFATFALTICGAIVTVTITVSSKADKTELQSKADKTEVASLALTVSTLADKSAVESLAKTAQTLADKLAELSAQRREDYQTLKYIREMADKTDSRMVKFEDGQKWQIQQEVQRLQWQSFKPEPPPPANVNTK